VAGYTRQSSADIIATAVVRANPLNVEYNALRDAFNASTGHKHDGTAAEGAYVPLIADSDALNKVVIDTSNNRVGVFVEVSSAAVEQIRIQDGAVVPVTNNDIDLGTSSLQFKDLFIDGTATVDALQVDANAVVTGNFTVNGNATLGNAASDTVTITADVASPLLPSADDTYDLGAVGSEWRNLYIDGTANIDALVADTADINGGTVDGAVIGGASAAAGTFTSLNASGTSTLTTVDINGGNIDGTIIGASSAAAITGTTITGTSLVGPVTGDVTGNADTATALETARTIGGVSFNGTANINLPGVNASGNQDTSGNAATATALETARTIGGVSFNGTSNINLAGVNTAGNQDTSGNAASATVLETARTIAGNSFNGSANITIAATDLSDTDQSLATGDNVQFAQVTTTGNAIVGGDLTVNGTTTTINSSNMTVDDQLIELGNGRSGSASGDAGIVIERGSDSNAFIGFDESADKFTVGTGTFTGASTGDLTITTGTLVANIEGNVTGAVTGNADTATALATARTIAGQSFDGTANITIAPTDLTGVNTTATELNIMDGDTSATSTTLADADRVVVNDAGTMKQVALTDFETYMETSLDTLSNVTTVGALNSGSITSGFGAIDVGSSAITTTGTINFGSLADGSITATGFVDEDNMSSNSATLIPTQQSVKAYVDTVAGTSNNVTGLTATGAELNTVADFSAVSVDTSTAIASNDALLVFDNGNEIGYRDVDLLDTYFSGTTKTLTNKTLTSPVVTGMHLNDSGFTVEGSGADGNETTVAFTNPTADHTITFPNATGNVAVFTAAPAAAIADGSNGQVLTTNGSGVLSFSDMASGADLYAANPSSATDPVASGANAVAVGHAAVASGTKDMAFGAATDATGGFSVALGNNAQATGSSSVAIGSSRATASDAVAIGIGGNSANGATGSTSVAIGNGARSEGTRSVAFTKAYASGQDSFAVGNMTSSSNYGAQGTNSIAMGYQAKAAGTSSVAIGYQAQTTTANEIVLGGTTNQVKISSAYTLPTSDGSANQVLTTNGSGAVTFADAGGGADLYAANESSPAAQPSATGANAIALGDSAVASGSKSIALGYKATATANFATAFAESRAAGEYSFAAGIANDSTTYGASGAYSISIGYQSRAKANQSVALGSSAYVDSDSNRGLSLGENAYVEQMDYGSAIGANARVHGGNSATHAVALGTSRAAGSHSFAAAIANNTSTYGATGANSVAIGNLAKATGADSVAIGESSQATAADAIALGRTVRSTSSYAVAMGYNCLSAGSYSVALGYQATASGNNAFAAGASSTYAEKATASGNGSVALGGAYATATDSVSIGASSTTGTTIGKIAFSNDKFSANGDSQGGQFILRADTTDVTATVLTTNNNTAAATNQIVAASDTCITFDGTITAMQNGAQAYASWKIEGLLVNDGGTTTLANSATTVIQNLSSWGMALSADNTNNALAITCTGEASHSIRWVANIRTTEVTYA